jgi:hypothetical protein
VQKIPGEGLTPPVYKPHLRATHPGVEGPLETGDRQIRVAHHVVRHTRHRSRRGGKPKRSGGHDQCPMGRIDLYPRLSSGLSACQIMVVAASRLRGGDKREGGEEREP